MHTGMASCFDNVAVQQIGFFRVPPERQALFPFANFSCNGRITGVTASVDTVTNGVTLNYPYLEVWHPQAPGVGVFDKVGEVQIKSEVVKEVDASDNTFWLLSISLNGSDRVEFEFGDVIGFFQPSDMRYVLWMIETKGYTGYGNIASISSSTLSIAAVDITAPDRQPMFELIVGMN